MTGKPAARELGADAVAAACGVGEVDQLVLGELRMQHHVLQPALAVHRDFRKPVYRSRIEHTL